MTLRETRICSDNNRVAGSWSPARKHPLWIACKICSNTCLDKDVSKVLSIVINNSDPKYIPLYPLCDLSL